MADIRGDYEPRFAPLVAAFSENFDAGLELGASLAVVDGAGNVVCDVWAGYADQERTRPWERDSLMLVYSTSKIVTAICALILVDRGLVELDAPICRRWPEFAAQGKERVTLRHVLTHQTGLPGWSPPITGAQLLDAEWAAARLAEQAPWWEPGTATGYQVLTFGCLIGELVRRVTGQSMADFLQENVCGPLGADFYFGLPPAHRHRAVGARYDDVELDDSVDHTPFGVRALQSIQGPMRLHGAEGMGAVVASANGWGNARSVAKLGAILSNHGAVGDVRILSEETAALGVSEQSYRVDVVQGLKVRWGLGVALGCAEFPFGHPDVAAWGGYGGSFCHMDFRNRETVGYVMNNMITVLESDPRELRIKEAWVRSIGT